MIKPNKNIKKLSTAMFRGIEIAKERGIKRITGDFFQFNGKGEVCGACALGMAVLGIRNVKEIEQNFSNSAVQNLIREQLNSEAVSSCLPKKVSAKVRNKHEIDENMEAEAFVVSLNDGSRKNPKEIAAILKECNL